MIQNFLKITFRNMVRNKLFTSINILGMSVSLACCMLLFSYASQELSYDTHHTKPIYRITSDLSQKDGESFHTATSSVPIAPVIEHDIPEINRAVRVTGGALLGAKDLVTIEDNSFYIENGYVVDPELFNVFEYDIIEGNTDTPLPFSNAVVIEKEWAIKLFGEEDPIGKSVKISTILGESDYEVSAVYNKDTYQTHLTPSYILSTENASWKGFLDNFSSQWVGNNLVYTYIELVPGSDHLIVEDKIHDIFLEKGGEEMKAIGLSKKMYVEPITDIHTNTDLMMNMQGTVNLLFIQVLILIGVLILLLACVNYINLSTAQAGTRELEVGIRKVMGVSSNGLVFQFLGESFLIVLISLIIGIGFTFLAIPAFNQLISSPLILTPEMLSTGALYLLVFLIVTTFFAGIYPSLYLSSFKPSQVLKGKNRDKGGAAFLRKILVVFQFVISIVLISSIVIISQQVDYIKNKDLGFDANTKLIIPLRTEEAAGQYATLKKDFSSNAAVRGVSGADAVPGTIILNDILAYKKGQTMDDAIHIYNDEVDMEYAQVLGVKLVSGSYFQGYNQDSLRGKILVNQVAIEQWAFTPEEAIGEIVYFDWRGEQYEFEIIGVVENIHQSSLHTDIDPLMFHLGRGERYQYMIIDAELSNFQNLISDLRGQWVGQEINTPFEYFTLNDNLQILYESDFKTFNLIKYFGIISVIISGLGLYALSMFMAVRRFKEIGVRKALGAKVSDILIMVSADLSKLIFIAFIASVPITIFGMGRWLETFAYRITPGVGTYLVAGTVSILIGWMAISYQSIKAAMTNPVNVLRDE
jgi:putative ABC transport system permease protein